MVITRKQTLAVAFASLLNAAAAASECGDLELPWGTYKATELSSGSICKYANVRFASPPVGELRFAAPSYPPKSGEPEAEGEPMCMQMRFEQCTIGSPLGSATCFPETGGQETEDCLFLDIHVPKAALKKEEAELPVVVWIYGGAFTSGSKTQYASDDIPFYDSRGLMEATDEHMIFVAGNYRLGAFGWLAGSYMEEHGQPNAGLLDQRAILQFVRDHIHLVKGDPENVSVWGESAGASSIMHHLTMPENVKAPLFHRAILQSPAFQWLWDRKGSLNDTFRAFYETVADQEDCGDKTAIDCIRNADADALSYANQAMFRSIACQGIMPVGPSVDGKLIEDIATNLYQNTSKVTKLNSLIVSHTDNEVSLERGLEGFSFIPFSVRMFPQNEEVFQDFLEHFMLGDDYEPIRADISKKYPVNFQKDQVLRTRTVVEQASFYCNTRVIIEAYQSKGVPVYAMNYAYLNTVGLKNLATHGTDLIPTFINSQSNLTHLYNCLSGEAIGGSGLSNFTVTRLGPGLRSYFISHAISGDPNVHAQGEAAEKRWEKSRIDNIGNKITQVMQPGGNLGSTVDPFSKNSVSDDANTALKCTFWKDVAKKVADAYEASQTAIFDEHADDEHFPVLHEESDGQKVLGEWEL